MSHQIALIAESEPRVQRIVGHFLERLGFFRLMPRTGAQVLLYLKHMGPTISIVLLDTNLRGTRWQHMLLQIRETQPHIAVLLMHAGAPLDLAALPIAERPDGVLYKPFGLDDLRSVIPC